MPGSLIITGSVSFPVGWSAAAHRHPHPELILVTQGSMSVYVGDVAFAATSGDLLLYQPGVAHRECNTGRRELSMIYVHAGLDPAPSPLIRDRGGRIGQLVRWLAEDQAAGASGEALAAWAEAIRPQVGLAATGRSTGTADAVRAILRAQIARDHRLDSLARTVGVGARQLLRRYREETRTTPMADLRRMRCEAAADLLASTDWPLERIADEVGFCDAFHLSKVFRARYGLPPGRMRSRVQR